MSKLHPCRPITGQTRKRLAFYNPHSQTFFNNSLELSEEKRIFAARKLNY